MVKGTTLESPTIVRCHLRVCIRKYENGRFTTKLLRSRLFISLDKLLVERPFLITSRIHGLRFSPDILPMCLPTPVLPVYNNENAYQP